MPGARIHAAASAKASAALALSGILTKQQPPPKSALDFEKACKLLSGNSETLTTYIKSIDPNNYRTLLKESLSLSHVTPIVRVMAGLVVPEPGFVAHALERLSAVNRFSMIAMQLPAAEKVTLKGVFEALEGAGHDVAELRAKYRIK